MIVIPLIICSALLSLGLYLAGAIQGHRTDVKTERFLRADLTSGEGRPAQDHPGVGDEVGPPAGAGGDVEGAGRSRAGGDRTFTCSRSRRLRRPAEASAAFAATSAMCGRRWRVHPPAAGPAGWKPALPARHMVFGHWHKRFVDGFVRTTEVTRECDGGGECTGGGV